MPRETPVRLLRPLERAVVEGHPWLYRDALSAFLAQAGEVVTVQSRGGKFLARGFADEGPIGVRVLTTRDEPVDDALLARRLRRASELRDLVVPPETNAYRLVHGEGDRLPGLVIDVYGELAVMRLDGDGATAFYARHEGAIRPVLEARGIRTLLRRTGRKTEVRTDVRFGRAPEGLLEVRERGMALVCDVMQGQKTGLFLDHRESRFRVRELARGKRVLNLYGYTGGFSVGAGLGGASHVTTVDIAPAAIALAQRTWEANGLAAATHEGVASDVPDFLAKAGGARWDLVVADPPSFAPNAKSLPKALASYVALHAACIEHVVPGGLYLAASCSSHVDASAFLDTVRTGAQRTRRVVQVLDRWGAPGDHPRLLGFPEGDYLKVVLTRVLD